MKLQLEQALETCPKQLQCVVCGQDFRPSPIRTLLCNDKEWILGDLCSHCTSLKTRPLQQKLRERSTTLFLQAKSKKDRNNPSLQLAQELLETAQEDLTKPYFYAWWLKQMEILAQESPEVEAARLGLSQCHCRQRSDLNRIFKKSL